MRKREDYVKQLQLLLSKTDPREELEQKLLDGSNLPGPRGNLELAYAFGDCFEDAEVSNKQWALLTSWAGITADEAPTNDPKEFLVFCALQAFGVIYEKAPNPRQERIIGILKSSANDKRWRTREAVAMSFQRIGEKDFKIIEGIFADWIKHGTLAEQRAIVAALAHPPILKKRDNILFCLKSVDDILNGFQELGSEERKAEDFAILKKGLAYSISVFVAALPDEGFAFLKKWALMADPAINKIIKANLGKSRLTKKYGDQVTEVYALLN